MLEPRGHPDLAQEPLAVTVARVEDLHRLWAVRLSGHERRGPQHLDRDLPVEPFVVAVVDLAHAAAAEQPVHPVPPRQQLGQPGPFPAPRFRQCASAP
jgi:hypothetical protein